MKLKSILLLGVLALALGLVVSGCGGDGAGYPTAEDTQVAETTGDTGAEEAAEEEEPSKPGKTPKVSGASDEKPEITETSGDPPEKMVMKDIKKGTGKAAKNGDEVTVQYVGKNWSNSEEFDTSWGKDPFKFTLGEGGVIQGWDIGVVGMKKGGRRLLVIPPDLGYGAQGSGSIPANETLVFVVDLEDIN